MPESTVALADLASSAAFSACASYLEARPALHLGFSPGTLWMRFMQQKDGSVLEGAETGTVDSADSILADQDSAAAAGELAILRLRKVPNPVAKPQNSTDKPGM